MAWRKKRITFLLIAILVLNIPLQFSMFKTTGISLSNSKKIIDNKNSSKRNNLTEIKAFLKKHAMKMQVGRYKLKLKTLSSVVKIPKSLMPFLESTIELSENLDKVYLHVHFTRKIEIKEFKNLEKVLIELFNTEIVSYNKDFDFMRIAVPLTLLKNVDALKKTFVFVKAIEPSVIYSVASFPDDPSWGLQWGPQKIKVPIAWNTTLGSHNVLVAIIDTGIDYTHPDLDENYVALGYDWVNNDTDPMDDHSHGTHVAGIVAAEINNSLGIAGIANVSIMAEKFLDKQGNGNDFDAFMAIVDAVQKGADILSNSWGGTDDTLLLRKAIEYAYSNGVLLIGAAGNNLKDTLFYPAAYPEVIAVTNVNQADQLSSDSNYGDWVDLAAPGTNIYSTVLNHGYGYKSGTSMAAPFVTGVAALVWSVHPEWNAEQVRYWLSATAQDLGAKGHDEQYGYGRLDAAEALNFTTAETIPFILKVVPESEYSVQNYPFSISYEVITFKRITSLDVKIYINNSLINATEFSNQQANAKIRGEYVYWFEDVDIYNLSVGVYDNLTGYASTWSQYIKVVSTRGYSQYDSSFKWYDAKENGSIISLGDDATYQHILPFTFNFFDKEFQTIFIGSNGVLSFITDIESPTPIAFPHLNPLFSYILAPFWSDLYPQTNIYIYSTTSYFVVEYYNISYYGGDRAGTFEVVLFKNGSILFSYRELQLGNLPYISGLNYGIVPVDYNVVFESQIIERRSVLFEPTKSGVKLIFPQKILSDTAYRAKWWIWNVSAISSLELRLNNTVVYQTNSSLLLHNSIKLQFEGEVTSTTLEVIIHLNSTRFYDRKVIKIIRKIILPTENSWLIYSQIEDTPKKTVIASDNQDFLRIELEKSLSFNNSLYYITMYNKSEIPIRGTLDITTGFLYVNGTQKPFLFQRSPKLLWFNNTIPSTNYKITNFTLISYQNDTIGVWIAKNPDDTGSEILYFDVDNGILIAKAENNSYRLVLENSSFNFIYDSQAPQIKNSPPKIIYVEKNASRTTTNLTWTFSDAHLFKILIYINDIKVKEFILNQLYTEYEFQYSVPLVNGTTIKLVVFDLYNNTLESIHEIILTAPHASASKETLLTYLGVALLATLPIFVIGTIIVIISKKQKKNFFN